MGSRCAEALRKLGYELITWEEPGEEPEEGSRSFADVVPELRRHPKAGLRLYRHQEESIEALEAGMNVVLTARTGSGKTEAWALAALRNGWRVLAVYPTLALAADQIRRLEEYYEAAGAGPVVRVDRPSLSSSRSDVAKAVSEARLVVTNPAFLMAELKRMATSPGRAVLEDFLQGLDLLVVDELDFYGPRSAHLLVAMAELISTHLSSPPPRIAVLSATLGNPEELAALLTRINGRKTRVIEGKPFKTPSRVMVVVGKGADALRRFAEAHAPLLASRAPWVLEVLGDEEEFRDHLYEVYEALEALGLRPPRPGLDPIEVLQAVLESSEEGMVTLVFTRSIRMAEKLYRGLAERLPAEKMRLVRVHHHLVSKRKRSRIEEEARQGKIRMIITVRTLAQGIDIGNVNRVVHIGLPLDLREYMQREGRKGRRRDIGVSETIVVPSGLWDRKLLEAGASTLKQWLSLHLEKLYINPGHVYAAVFKALWRLLRGHTLAPEEEQLLLRLGLVEHVSTLTGSQLGLSPQGRRFWGDLGFYEHGPPYGYRKVVVSGGREEMLRGEEVSHRDAVEKYQPGTYDHMTEMIVVSVDPRRLRIYEQSPAEAIRENEWLSRAHARYVDVKKGWGERPDLEADLRYGRLDSAVVLNTRTPLRGFGALLEEPVEVVWLVESRRPRLARGRRGVVRVYHEVAVLELGAPVAGRYRDYTYGYVFEAPGDVPAEELRLGLAALLVYLRLSEEHAVPLTLLSYRVASAGSVKLIYLWEREAAGLLERLDWGRVAEEVAEYRFPEVTVPLIAAVDPAAALSLARGEVDWDRLRSAASRTARILAGSVVASAGAITVEYPRPGSGHGLAAVYALYTTVSQGGRSYAVAAVASTDGDDVRVDSISAPVSFDASSRLSSMILSHLDKLLSRRLVTAYYGEEQRSLLIRLLSASYTGVMAFRSAESEGLIVDAAREVAEKTGGAPILSIVEPRIRAVLEEVEKAEARKDPAAIEKAYREAAAVMASAVYKALLAARKGKIVVKPRG